MLTIGLGAMFRTFAIVTWGSEIYTLPTPFSAMTTRSAASRVSHQYLSIIVGTLVLCGVLYAFFTTRASAWPCRRPRRTSSPPTTWASR